MCFSFIIYTSIYISSSPIVFSSLKVDILILEIYYIYVKSSKINIYKNTNANRPIEKELEITRLILF